MKKWGLTVAGTGHFTIGIGTKDISKGAPSGKPLSVPRGNPNSMQNYKPNRRIPVNPPIWKRKKDAADVQFSRRLRKPRKRNGAEFF